MLITAKIINRSGKKTDGIASATAVLWRYGYAVNRLLRMLLRAGAIALLISMGSLLLNLELIYLRNLGMLIGFQIIIYALCVVFRGRFPLPGRDYL